MAYLLFIDESGHDGTPPYEVLAGVAVRDSRIWPMVQRIHELEVKHFGGRITPGQLELKGTKLLKKKTFRHAAALPEMPLATRSAAARTLLDDPENPTKQGLAGLAQSKLAFVADLLRLCREFGVVAFASVMPRGAPRPPPAPDGSAATYLRKDYSFLFERFYQFLVESRGNPQGIVVFDELEKSQSHILLDQLHHYFLETAKGKMRSTRVLPEALFVHSHLTTLVQVADIAAYLMSWGVRRRGMQNERRRELASLAHFVLDLEYRFARKDGGPWSSFTVISDLRSKERKAGKRKPKRKGNAGTSPAKPPTAVVELPRSEVKRGASAAHRIRRSGRR